jgi:hypothetical protein
MLSASETPEFLRLLQTQTSGFQAVLVSKNLSRSPEKLYLSKLPLQGPCPDRNFCSIPSKLGDAY